MPPEQLQKLKHYKDVLHCMIPYSKLPKEKLPKAFNLDKVEAFEKQILNIMQTFKQRWASFSGGPGGSAQSQTAPSNSGQSQPTPGQQLDPISLPKKFATIAATATNADGLCYLLHCEKCLHWLIGYYLWGLSALCVFFTGLSVVAHTLIQLVSLIELLMASCAVCWI